MQSLNIDSAYIDKYCNILYIFKLLKSAIPAFRQHPLELPLYATYKSLCVVSLISSYLGRISVLSEKDNSSFLVNYVTLGETVSPKTIVRCVVETLEKSGMNTKSFKAHWIRSASTSAPRCKVVSLIEIAKAARWTNCLTFEKFFEKPVNVINFRLNSLISECKTL